MTAHAGVIELLAKGASTDVGEFGLVLVARVHTIKFIDEGHEWTAGDDYRDYEVNIRVKQDLETGEKSADVFFNDGYFFLNTAFPIVAYDEMENMSNRWAASGKRMTWMEEGSEHPIFPDGEDFADFEIEQKHTIVSYKNKMNQELCAYPSVIKVEVFKDSIRILMSGMTSSEFWGQPTCGDVLTKQKEKFSNI